jgi:uncharacterized protein YjbJ (UPF0337 family)
MSKLNNHKDDVGKAKIVAPTPKQTNQGRVSEDTARHPSVDANKGKASVETDNTMRQQKQQKQYQREPQQQPGGKVINTDTPDSFPRDHEQEYQSRSYQTRQTSGQNKQSQQQQQSSPTVDLVKAKWQKHAAAAKIVWGKLTNDEILESEGRAEKLSALVSERYAVDRREANEQVKNFLDKCNLKSAIN